LYPHEENEKQVGGAEKGYERNLNQTTKTDKGKQGITKDFQEQRQTGYEKGRQQ